MICLAFVDLDENDISKITTEVNMLYYRAKTHKQITAVKKFSLGRSIFSLNGYYNSY